MDRGGPNYSATVSNLTADAGGFNIVNIHTGEGLLEDQATKLERCRNTIFLTDPEIDRAGLISAKGKRVEGTCEWIREDAAYKDWHSGDTRLLWISGGPGKGKTILSIFLTQELDRHGGSIYYFCSNDDEKRNNATAVLRGLIWHITARCPPLADHLLEPLGHESRAQATLSSRETLWSLFVKLVQDPRGGTVNCVLDGLDECDEESQGWLVTKLMELGSSKWNAVFKLAVVSRPLPGLAQCSLIELDIGYGEQIGKDIKGFVSVRTEALSEMLKERALSERVRELDESYHLTDALRHEVAEILLQRSEGTWLWVGFAMRELFRKRTVTEVMEALRTLPKGLPNMYRRMLQQIDQNDRPTSLSILQCVTVAVRPLSPLDLATLIRIKASGHITQAQAVRDQIHVCGPLVRIYRPNANETAEVVGLVHQSVKEYLLDGHIDGNAMLEGMMVKSEEAHLTVALACVKHLEQVNALGEARRKYEGDISDAESVRLRRKPLDDYAIRYWTEHANGAAKSAWHLLHQSPLFKEQSHLRDKWWLEYRQKAWRLRRAAPPASIHLACHLGMLSWIQEMLRKNWTPLFDSSTQRFYWLVNLCDSNGLSPLWWAAYAGDAAAVRLLLANGARPNAYRKTEEALTVACKDGHEAIVRLLLEKQADVNAQGGDYGNALQAASVSGNQTIVQLLLAAGAKVNAKGGLYGSALQAASSKGEEAIVRQLLSFGADVNAQGGFHGNPLQAASYKWRKAIVQLLLEHGAFEDWSGENGEEAQRNYKRLLRG
ncbi:hypothetical protein LTR17_012145 [Elasticomyces elasticus]|nr:hypothetical protein LTR17_012145 [Elasticomyces elasticus]